MQTVKSTTDCEPAFAMYCMHQTQSHKVAQFIKYGESVKCLEDEINYNGALKTTVLPALRQRRAQLCLNLVSGLPNSDDFSSCHLKGELAISGLSVALRN